MIPCTIAWMYKHLPLQDWLSYCDKFGLPGVLSKTDAAPDSEEWKANVEAVQSLANDWAAVFSRSSEVQLLEARGGDSLPFAPMVERMDRAMITLWRGADLATMSGKDKTGATLQGDESEILETDYAALIAETLNERLTAWVLDYYFGETVPKLAYLRIKTAPHKDMELDLKVDEFLIRNGAPLSIENALERYNRQAATEGQGILQAAEPNPPSLL